MAPIQVACAISAAVLIVVASDTPTKSEPTALVLSHGIASGDVTASSAVIWARASGQAQMHVEVATDSQFQRVKSSRSAAASEATDFTAQLVLNGLDADTRYWYRVWFAGPGAAGRSQVSESPVGTFKTAPAASQSRAVSFIVGADLGGQRFCRNAATGGTRSLPGWKRLRRISSSGMAT